MVCPRTFRKIHWAVAVLLIIICALSTSFAYDWKTAPAPGTRDRAMAVGPDRSLWLATQEGVSRWRNGEWDNYPIKGLPGKNCTPHIAFSPAGAMYLTYYDVYLTAGVLCIYWANDDWQYEEVYGKGQKGLNASGPAFSPDGTMYVAVMGQDEVVRLAKRGKDGVWSSRVIDDANRGHYLDLRISKTGIATIAYQSWTDSSVTIAEGPVDGDLVIRKLKPKGGSPHLEFTKTGGKFVGYSDVFDGKYFLGTLQLDGQIKESMFEQNTIDEDQGHTASYAMTLVNGTTPLFLYLGPEVGKTGGAPLRMARFEGKAPEKCPVVDDKTVASTYQDYIACALIDDTLYVSYTLPNRTSGCISWTKLPPVEQPATEPK